MKMLETGLPIHLRRCQFFWVLLWMPRWGIFVFRPCQRFPARNGRPCSKKRGGRLKKRRNDFNLLRSLVLSHLVTRRRRSRTTVRSWIAPHLPSPNTTQGPSTDSTKTSVWNNWDQTRLIVEKKRCLNLIGERHSLRKKVPETFAVRCCHNLLADSSSPNLSLQWRGIKLEDGFPINNVGNDQLV